MKRLQPPTTPPHNTFDITGPAERMDNISAPAIPDGVSARTGISAVDYHFGPPAPNPASVSPHRATVCRMVPLCVASALNTSLHRQT